VTAGPAECSVTGVQTPRLSWMPVGDWDYSLGEECIVWARDVLRSPLDKWERICILRLGARRPDGRWACSQFGLCLSRRNGKSHVLVVWLLFRVLVLGAMAAEYTAHHGKTVRATFKIARRLLDDAAPGLPDHRPYVSAGRESLMFTTGQELAFSTRTGRLGRGTGADVLAVDEAQEAEDDEMEALTPTLGDHSMTIPGPQLIYAGSAGNFASVVFARVRRRALACTSSTLGYLEWSIDDEAYWAADTFERERMAMSVDSMAQANPSLNAQRADGSGLSLDWLLGQIDTLTPAGFAREHEGVGTWPKDDGSDWLIPRARWSAVSRPDDDVPTTGLVLAVSATWGDRAFSIAAAGAVDEGCYGWLERMDRGTSWVVADLVRLAKVADVKHVMIDGGGPASAQADEIEKALAPAGVTLHRLSGRESAQAYGALSDAVTAVPPSFFHRGQVEVNAALAGAKRKDIGDGLWVFDRKRSESDVAPLEAVALARHGWVLFGGDNYNVLDSVF
jgi:hypothetical protein